MTDEPATTPAADNPWAIPDLTQAEKDDLMAALAEMRQPDPRVTALTLRCGQFREQRDEARRERDECADRAHWLESVERILTAERDAARAQVRQLMACQTAAGDIRDLRAVARDVITDCAARFCNKPATCACSMARMIRLMAPDGAGSVHRAETGASVDPSATPDPLGPQIGAES